MKKVLKRVISCLALAALFLAECDSCGQPTVISAASTPTVTRSLTIKEGKKKTIKVKGSNIKSPKFESSDTRTAKVSQKGVVTAKKTGSCIITVTVKYRKTKSAKKISKKELTCKVIVWDGKATSPEEESIVATTPGFKKKEETNALKEMIHEQKELGATVSENLDSEEYIWSVSGSLLGIEWNDKNVIVAGWPKSSIN